MIGKPTNKTKFGEEMTSAFGAAQPTSFQSQFSLSIPPIMSGVENKLLQSLYKKGVVKTVSLLQK